MTSIVRWLLWLMLVFSPMTALAQSYMTTVTAQVKDINGTLYNSCRYSATLINLSTSTLTLGGTALPDQFKQVTGTQCAANGNLSTKLVANTALIPSNSQWRFTICDNTGANCFNVQLAITGTTQDITTQVQAAAVILPISNTTLLSGNNNFTGNNTHSGTELFNATAKFKAGPWFDVTAYGATGNGSTDDYASVMAAITAAYNVGGGIVYFPKGTYRINSRIVMPNDGALPYAKQPPITFRGDGEMWDGSWSTPVPSASILDLRYVGSDSKIVTIGSGSLTMERLTLTSANGSTGNPIFYTTRTTVFIHNNTFIGFGAGGSASVTDAIVAGGTTGLYNNTETSGFQGYGSVIERNNFSFIRRAVYGRTYFNSVVIENNTISLSCGADNTAAAIEIDGTGDANGGAINGDVAQGNFIMFNLMEVRNYIYGVNFHNSKSNLLANSFWDEVPATFVAEYHTWGDNASTTDNLSLGGHDVTTLSEYLFDENGHNNSVMFFDGRVLRGTLTLHDSMFANGITDTGDVNVTSGAFSVTDTTASKIIATWGASGNGRCFIQNAGSTTSRHQLTCVNAAGTQMFQIDQANGVKIGANGSFLGTILTGTATLTYTAIAAQTCQDQPITVPNASATNFGAQASPRATLGNANLSWSAWVSAAGTVSVRVCNNTAGSITPSAVAWGVTVNQ